MTSTDTLNDVICKLMLDRDLNNYSYNQIYFGNNNNYLNIQYNNGPVNRNTGFADGCGIPNLFNSSAIQCSHSFGSRDYN
jgi:hypothetical protein